MEAVSESVEVHSCSLSFSFWALGFTGTSVNFFQKRIYIENLNVVRIGRYFDIIMIMKIPVISF
jgi:hypothetical protein